MSVRKIVLVLLALVIAGATVQFTRSVMSQKRVVAPVETKPTAPQGTRILVAAGDLPAGTLVQPSHLRWRAWPEDEGLATNYMVEGARTVEEFQGAVVRQGLRAGEPVAAGRLVKPGERGFLSAVLTPGMRAVSVAVNGVSGIGGFVAPGDRIDVLLSQKVRAENGEGNERHVAETVLTDVRILAMDQRTDDQKGEVKIAQIATLEVTARQAEAVALAAQLGAVSLSLRSLGVPAPDGVEVAAAESLVTTVTDAVTNGAGGAEPARPAAGPDAPPVQSRSITWDSDLSRAVQNIPGGIPAPAPQVNQPENAPAVVKVHVVRGSGIAEMAFPQR